jgi:DNA recombination protein RmuC
MNTFAIFIVVIVFGMLFLITQLAFYFSRHIKRMESDVSAYLAQINENLSLHLKDSLKLIYEANQNIGDRLDSATKVVGDVKEHLGKMEESNRRLYEIGKDISSLQDLLRAPKIRGGIGEYILEELLKQILPKEYYTLQYEFKSRERVDAVIRFGAGIVPVDAKFPLENFKRMLKASDEKEYIALKKIFIADIKNHIKAISEKYIVPDEGTFDFALMYIPAENVYYETIIKDETIGGEAGISQYALNKKVIPVSPNSIYAYLQVILLGFKGLAIEKRAKEILFNIAHLKNEFDKFSADFTKIGKHIDNAKSNYSESEKRLMKLTDKLAHIESLDKPEERVKSIDEK